MYTIITHIFYYGLVITGITVLHSLLLKGQGVTFYDTIHSRHLTDQEMTNSYSHLLYQIFLNSHDLLIISA